MNHSLARLAAAVAHPRRLLTLIHHALSLEEHHLMDAIASALAALDTIETDVDALIARARANAAPTPVDLTAQVQPIIDRIVALDARINAALTPLQPAVAA